MTLVVLLLPLLAAALIMLSPWRWVQRTLAVLGTLATFILALFLPGAADIDTPWFSGFGLHFALSPAGAASVLVPVVALVMIPTALYAGSKIKERVGAFLALLLVMQAALNGIFMAKDLILFYVCWEAALIPNLLMLGIWGREKRRQAMLKYMIYAIAGSFLMLIAILAIKPLSGAASYRFADLLAVTPQLPLSTQVWLFIGFTLSFAVKLPLFPVHGWLPDFHEQNHPSGVVDVAGTMYKLGAFGFFAWALPLLPDAASTVGPILLALSAVTALYAGFIATAQSDMKRFLAYVSLSHMGIVGVGVFGLRMVGLNGAMYLLAAQMLTTGGLFFLSGMLYERRQTFDLARYSGLAKSAPLLASLAMFILLAAIGVPGLTNFPGEFMSLMGAFQTSPWWAALATLTTVAAAVYGVNFYQKIFWVKEEHGAVLDLRGIELVVLIPMLLGILWFGILPHRQLALIEPQSQVISSQHEVQQADAAPLTDVGGIRVRPH